MTTHNTDDTCLAVVPPDAYREFWEFQADGTEITAVFDGTGQLLFVLDEDGYQDACRAANITPSVKGYTQWVAVIERLVPRLPDWSNVATGLPVTSASGTFPNVVVPSPQVPIKSTRATSSRTLRTLGRALKRLRRR